MGIGAIAISTTQKKEPSGAPFTAGSARNGTSIDSTGRVVLGNDLGDAAAPARLLNDREIITDDLVGTLFNIFLNAALNGVTTRMDGTVIEMVGQPGTAPTIQIIGQDPSTPTVNVSAAGAGAALVQAACGALGTALLSAFASATGVARLSLAAGAESLTITVPGTGVISGQVNAAIDMWAMDVVNFTTQIGPTITTFNGATFQITGTLTNRRFVQSQGAGAYNVDRNLDSGKNFINSAAATFNLPNMAAANNRPGFIFRLCVKNVAGVAVQAFAGQVIRFGSLATSAGGTLASIDVGAYVVLVWDSTDWITETFNGAWTLT